MCVCVIACVREREGNDSGKRGLEKNKKCKKKKGRKEMESVEEIVITRKDYSLRAR